MFLKILKLAAMLVSVMFISPVIKYQPDILKAALKREVDWESSEALEVKEAETVVEKAETTTEEPCSEINSAEKKEIAAERETAEESESILAASADTAMTVEPELPEPVTEPESEIEVESEPITESNAVAASSESSRSDSETFITTEPSTEHQHTWISVSETVHHEAVYQTVHHEAQTETVWIEDKPAWEETRESSRFIGMHDICKGCGMDITASGMSFEEYEAHDRQHILNGEDSSYYSQPVFETITEIVHHDAEGHYEDRVVQEPYDESVLVSEAWDEEVITGYVCEECGEVKR